MLPTAAYGERSYYDLADMPAPFVGRFDLDKARYRQRLTVVAIHLAGTLAGAARSAFWD
ncbi:MAG: hypothetical protein IPG75_20585 [Gemmatimonadetes bacterium]|nr:hypothetical protein [Gemmatimonadota bacterium]